MSIAKLTRFNGYKKTETIRVYSTAVCNYYAHLEVRVYKTGECKFIYDFI